MGSMIEEWYFKYINPSVQDLESEILADNKLLDEKIELGEKISKVLTNTNAKEESLSKKNKEAFNLYQSKKFAINPNDDLKLYPWQQQAIDLVSFYLFHVSSCCPGNKYQPCNVCRF